MRWTRLSGRLYGRRRSDLRRCLLLRSALLWRWLSVIPGLSLWLYVEWQGRCVGGRGLVVSLGRCWLHLLRLVVLLLLVHALLWLLRE